MKNTIVRYGVLITFFFVSILGCQKDIVLENKIETVDNELWITTKNQAAKIHKEYLDYVYNNTFSPIKTTQLSTIDLSTKFFSKYYSGNLSSEICTNSCNTFNLKTVDFDKIALAQSLFPSVNQIRALVLESQTSTVFTEKTDNILLNSTLDKDSKLQLASILGVVQGSYAYWNNPEIINKWAKIGAGSSKQKTTTILAGLAGATQTAESVFMRGEEATNAGAVIGGSTYSYLTILTNIVKYTATSAKIYPIDRTILIVKDTIE
jgi:hypothetical protein